MRGSSTKPGSLQRGEGRTGVAGGVTGGAGPGLDVWVPAIQLARPDAGPDPALRQVDPEGVAVSQQPDHTPCGGFRGKQRYLGATSPTRREPVREDDTGKPGIFEGLPEQFEPDEPRSSAWPAAHNHRQRTWFHPLLHCPRGLLIRAEDAAHARDFGFGPLHPAQRLDPRSPPLDEDQSGPDRIQLWWRLGQLFLEVARDGPRVVDGSAEECEETTRAMLRVPGGGRSGGGCCIWGEDSHHLREPGYSRLAGDGREVNQQLRAAIQSATRPQGVRQREALDERFGTRAAATDRSNGDLGRVLSQRGEPKGVWDDAESR